jgi:hypothetical protein
VTLSELEAEALLWAVRQCPLEDLVLAGVRERFGDGVGEGALASATAKLERYLIRRREGGGVAEDLLRDRELLRAGLRALSNAELAQVLLRLDEINESSTSLSVLVRDLADRVETEVEGS